MAHLSAKAPRLEGKPRNSLGVRLARHLQEYWVLYLMLLPVVSYFIIYKYIPMYGVTLAFKKWNAKLGILGSPWVGLTHFKRFFSSYNFKNILMNTLSISLYSLVLFPLPIVLALLLHYLDIKPLKKTVQMISYAPHFLSTVIIASILILF